MKPRNLTGIVPNVSSGVSWSTGGNCQRQGMASSCVFHAANCVFMFRIAKESHGLTFLGLSREFINEKNRSINAFGN
jgi:hypothetical protein